MVTVVLLVNHERFEGGPEWRPREDTLFQFLGVGTGIVAPESASSQPTLQVLSLRLHCVVECDPAAWKSR